MGSAEDPIEPASRFAIVGYAARFPGAADTDEFWDVLREGRDAISEVPKDRWDVDEFFDPEPGVPGKVVTRRAGFVDDVTGFDAPFFGMSTREVRLMDPQHRLLLETAWRAVEHSGTAPTALANTNTGVFVGLATHDYLGMASDELTYPEIEAYMAIGTSNAAAAGRISYRLGLQGPAVAVDTACSSSLVAIHQACQALRLGECDLALAGGANVLLTPATMITFSSAHMLAPDGRCKTFDAAADGYVRGEGCGVIVIKRLEDAIRDGDRIRAVIRGSAINQDGASGGLTVPNGVAQQRVIADALKRADLEPSDVEYLEAHGTGTSLGDPIEAQAAGAVFGVGREADRPLLIGSVEDEHRAPGSRRGDRGRHQGHPVARARDFAEAPALSEPVAAHSLGPAGGGGRQGGHRLGAQRSAAHRGCQLVRVRRDQRARHPRGSARAAGAASREPGLRAAGAAPRSDVAAGRPEVQHSSALGAHARRVGADRRPIPQLVERAPGGHLGGRVLHRRGGASTPGAPGRVGGQFERIRQSSCSARSRTTARRPVWFAENPTTRRRRRGCSPVRAASTPAWPGSCSTPSRCSPRR